MVTALGVDEEEEGAEPDDALETYIRNAMEQLRVDDRFLARVRGSGIPWKGVIEKLKEGLPGLMTDRDDIAHQNVARAMNEIFGESGWHTERRPSKSRAGYHTTWIVVGPEE